MQGEIDKLKTEVHFSAVSFAKIESDVKHIKETLTAIQKSLSEEFVTLEAFTPVKILAYGAVGMICSSTLAALITMVLAKK